ncbi:hypothetical protein QR680_010348 [Steinernema hermaphroditum]|uniref:Uncharacterized protein n=1 Tax=Steinernema hermaphroditum TaxID=289476 RepID=A0AA39IR52_9BILA|nr:hypothetical protein QR680_010348 [Steinernema hermaphroditum]
MDEDHILGVAVAAYAVILIFFTMSLLAFTPRLFRNRRIEAIRNEVHELSNEVRELRNIIADIQGHGSRTQDSDSQQHSQSVHHHEQPPPYDFVYTL